MIIVGYSRTSAASNLILPNVPDAIWEGAWDATDAANVTLDGSNVQTLADSVGTRHLTQTTSGFRPAYSSGTTPKYYSNLDQRYLNNTTDTFDWSTPKSYFSLIYPTAQELCMFLSIASTSTSDWAGIAQNDGSLNHEGGNLATNSVDVWLGGSLVGEGGVTARSSVWTALGSAVNSWTVLEIANVEHATFDEFHPLHRQGSTSTDFIGRAAWHGICSQADAATHRATIVSDLLAKTV